MSSNAAPVSNETGSGASSLSQADARDTTRSSFWWTVLTWLILGVLAAGAWHYRAMWWPTVAPYLSFKAPAPTKPPARVVPVVTATVRQRDLRLYLNGLGTATPFKTVTVRSRVEGELTKIAFVEGQMVNEGDLLAEIDPRELEVQRDQAEAQLARDEAALKSVNLTLTRYKDLLSSKTIAQQQVDDQIALVQQAEGTVRADQALVANAKLQLSYCRIEAPISGRIGLRLVDEGNIVRANEATGLAVITQLQPIAVVFTIPQDDIARVQLQSRDGRVLEVDAYDRDFKLKLASGTLAAIDNQVDPQTGTVRLKAVFANEDGLLFPNQFVNARLLVETRSNTLVVPSAAIQRGPASPFVYVVQADETVELRSVVIGPAEGIETSITSGLEPGETVVTEGIDKLQPGAKVSVREAATKDKKQSRGKEPPTANERETLGR
jgi:membrane fusion protein, multidrug efflux system